MSLQFNNSVLETVHELGNVKANFNQDIKQINRIKVQKFKKRNKLKKKLFSLVLFNDTGILNKIVKLFWVGCG